MPLQRDFSVSTVSVPGWLVIARLGGPSCAACWPPPGGTRDAEPATLLGVTQPLHWTPELQASLRCRAGSISEQRVETTTLQLKCS